MTTTRAGFVRKRYTGLISCMGNVNVDDKPSGSKHGKVVYVTICTTSAPFRLNTRREISTKNEELTGLWGWVKIEIGGAIPQD